VRSPRKKRVARYRSLGYGQTLERVAANVRHLREAQGWSQEEVCSRAGAMSERLYRLVESGGTNVTAATLTRLADAFAVDVSALIAPVRGASSKPRVQTDDAPVTSIAPAVAASLLLDPATLRDPAVAAALDAVLWRRGQLPRVANPAREDATAGPARSHDPPSGDGGDHAHSSPRAIVLPAVPKGSGLRAFLIALLVANPRGLLTAEMAEAAASAKLRHRKNEIHEIVRSLQESGDLTRDGRRGSFVYSLRRTPSAPA
jgi:transcriptional regulator with XRE-family HTH domain